jgi:hypothetical protein
MQSNRAGASERKGLFDAAVPQAAAWAGEQFDGSLDGDHYFGGLSSLLKSWFTSGDFSGSSPSQSRIPIDSNHGAVAT